jgi:hypothetical protein
MNTVRRADMETELETREGVVVPVAFELESGIPLFNLDCGAVIAHARAVWALLRGAGEEPVSGSASSPWGDIEVRFCREWTQFLIDSPREDFPEGSFSLRTAELLAFLGGAMPDLGEEDVARG